jgi:hypothetical protein
MNQEVLALIARERQDELRASYARGAFVAPFVRPLAARALRACGDRLFRWGVALDRRDAFTGVVGEASAR